MKKLLSFLFPIQQPPSLLAMSIQTFSTESFVQQITRQGNLKYYLSR